MSNLIARAGQQADLQAPGVQTVQVQDLSQSQAIAVAINQDEINLRELWRALRRRKKIVAVTAATVVALAAVVTTYQRIFAPVFQGTFSLLITDPISNDSGNNARAASADGTVFEELARNTTRNDIPTLIEVLRSPLLLGPIAARFNLTSRDLATRITITTGGERQSKAEGVLNVSVKGRDPVRDQQLLEGLSSAYLQAALQQRQQRLGDGLAFLTKQEPLWQERTAELQGEMAAFRRRHYLLEPTTEGGALKERIATMDTQVLGLQAERARLLRVRRAITDGSLSARGFQEAISTGDGNGNSNNGNQGLSVSGTDQSMLQQLQKVETELADARSRFNNNSSMVRGLEARLRQLKPLLRANQLEAVDAALSLNRGRQLTAERQQELLNKQFLRQPALIKQYEALQQRLKIAQDNLAGLVSARENFQLEIAQRSVPWRVIAPPEINPNPIQPSVPRNLALGVVLGLVAGAGAGLLRDRLDHVFHHPGEVREELGLPLLGHIPHVEFFQGVREDKRFLLEELDSANLGAGVVGREANGEADREQRQRDRYQRFYYQEAFRNLFTSLRFLNSDRRLASVAFTSSLPAEGKSLVVVLLAKTLSEMGQRVLLIDADLRKPQIHHRLGINNLVGLSNLLTDDDLHWRQAIQPVANHESWQVITAGRRPPDPTRLLSSQRLDALVNELTSCGEFDLVLFDTPPVLGLADAALLAEHCDGLVLLVSLDRVDRGLPREAVQRISSSGAPLLGVVTNAIKPISQPGTGYGYGYGSYSSYGSGGYGYAAYDTSAAYAHYAESDNTNESTGKLPAAGAPITSQPKSWRQWRSQLQQQQRRFMHWLDH